ncbi:unnamed protein product [Prorocentrum cordatum]|uniref:Uncharacterized protein n=1 Tax=Prorocentrum cordatum TaxID=2364126 RepID=A0ABN9WG29_9DINO|nr:unnamed protein product [Polarella glacialis]
MNDPKGYTKVLERLAKEEGLTLELFYRVEEARYRDVHCVIDAPDRTASARFLKQFRAQNVDVDRCGKPCRERKSEVVHELPLGPAAVEQRPALARTEYASPGELARHLAAAGHGPPVAARGPARAATGERLWAAAVAGGTRLHVCVCPGRRASELTNREELREDPRAPALRADLCAPPREGEANAELVRLLSSELRVPTAQVSLLSGGRSRDKLLKIAGVTPDEVEAILLAAQD